DLDQRRIALDGPVAMVGRRGAELLQRLERRRRRTVRDDALAERNGARRGTDQFAQDRDDWRLDVGNASRQSHGLGSGLAGGRSGVRSRLCDVAGTAIPWGAFAERSYPACQRGSPAARQRLGKGVATSWLWSARDARKAAQGARDASFRRPSAHAQCV